MADETEVQAVTDDDIGPKVLYEPPPDAQGAMSTPSVEYDFDIRLRLSILSVLTFLLQHCRHL